MRYAIFSDIHGNLPAWQKVLEDIRSLEADVLICLGDVVGYGPKPQEVLDGIRAATDYFVLGNHDAAAAGILDPSIFNDQAHAIVLWTRDHLNQESLEFLRDLPLKISTEDLLFVHAEASEPGRFHYIDNATIATENFVGSHHFATFVGHTHHPLVYERNPFGMVTTYPDEDRSLHPNCRYIINVGSAGEPRNPDDIRARYVIYDDDTKKVFFRRIDFDPEVYRRDLASTSLTHTPYFLQVLDHKETLEAAQFHAMEAPAEGISQVKTSQRKLVFPEPGSMATKPKPLPLRSSQKSSPVASLIVTGLLLLGLGAGYWSLKKRPTPTTDPSADLQASQPADAPAQQALPTATDQFAAAEIIPAKLVRRPGGVVTNSGMTQQRLLYAINDGQFDFLHPYIIDNSATISPGSFDRVGYFVELDNAWVWVSMDRFREDPKLLGVPQANSGIVENGTLVKNLVIDSNRDGLKKLNRPKLSGIIEFWSSNYDSAGHRKFGSSDKHFDWKDSGGTTKPGFGSFQIFAFRDSTQKSAATLFGITNKGGMGIGYQKPHRYRRWISTDWTFVPATYRKPEKRNLEIWVGNSE